ncbi:MAG: hypothetical protein U5K43_01630 [Halofilum sp. (in: g-proteobacteria)]|nr:hypothetical protein [Halofilum sp. (in: g-proteobacteria)]
MPSPTSKIPRYAARSPGRETTFLVAELVEQRQADQRDADRCSRRTVASATNLRGARQAQIAAQQEAPSPLARRKSKS